MRDFDILLLKGIVFPVKLRVPAIPAASVARSLSVSFLYDCAVSFVKYAVLLS